MANTTLPPGFRFHPTDEELIMYYLKRKVTGRKLHSEAKRAIPELNIRLYAPWELPGKSRSKDLEWYFFCPIEKKYASGSRMKRANETGFWKATGNDRTVTYKGRTVGKIKTLIFHQGHAGKGIRTDWVIHEYRMEDKHLADARIVQDSYVICKVFEKTGSGPKNGSQYGRPFIEEDWDNDDVCAEPDLSGVSPAMPAPTDCQSCPVGIESTSNFTLVEPGPSSAEPGSSLAEPHINELPEDADMIELLCPFFMEENGLLPIESNNNKNMSDLNQARSVEIAACNDGDDIYNGLGGLDNLPTLDEDGFCNTRNPWEETTAYYGDSDAYINQARSVEVSECNDGDDMFNILGYLGNLPTTGEDGFPNMTMAAAAGYVELDDLLKPLDESNCGSETQHLYPFYNNVEQSHIRGNTTSGSNPVAAEENIHPKPKGYNSW
ncbi:PREDICTED: NAC domain-containing protein 82-like [Ipomoea nil]|uniref:NAC domain-containing protein 82-like n=1 Tax=Ipomoea nil TaxID=35883 RepID=UPI000901ABD4|nr:PREDICTED: NAC domain-containing protein 82-like [Ipomoea nil]XP_019149695.1 PREDICTED: NAC domain-containing protein 82-like [Ipomoea nil]